MADNNIGNAFTLVASLLLMMGIGIRSKKRTNHFGHDLLGSFSAGASHVRINKN
ncbi:hypothetical protein LCGC14_0098100 [marine sediment metagenome]|uniref:Uncharacterized protein n=1 Tax=marine sediment metagenome TaxID=412755 RepID=A0A0F9XVI1_9ZZZZ